MSVPGLRSTTALGPDATGESQANPGACPQSGWTPAARSDELTGAGPFALSVSGLEVVALRTSKGLRAFEGRCPHQGALLGEGEIEDGKLVCRNHRWRFDVDTGENLDRTTRPACLRSCPVVERDGRVFINPGALQKTPSSVRARSRTVDDLGGPKGLPVVGSALDLDARRLHTVLEKWARAYGPLYRLKLGPRSVLVVSDGHLSQEILEDRPEAYRRIPNTERIAAELGIPGIFSAEGSTWRSLRLSTARALSVQNTREFYPILCSSTERLRQRWERAAREGTAVDPADDLRRLAADFTMQVAFGHDARALAGESDPIREKLELIFPFVARRLKAIVPYWRLVRSPADRRVDAAVADIRLWMSGRIAETRSRIAKGAGGSGPTTLLEVMLQSRDASGAPFTDEAILGNLVQVLLAGEDTTANTLAWAIHELCDEPDALTRMRGEIDSTMPPEGGAATIAQLESLSYTSAVANETLRLRPVVPILFMQANVDTWVGDVRVPSGSEVWLLRRAPGKDVRHFATPEAFRPGRWLDDRAAAVASGASYGPFGAGPRVCPGRFAANLEIRAVLAMIYRNFVVERVGLRDDVVEHFVFTLHPHGLRVRPRMRAGA